MITIHKSQTADSRTCDYSKVSKEQLLASSIQHIGDIRKGFEFFIGMMKAQAERHDLSKITHIDDFHRNFLTGFKETDWWDGMARSGVYREEPMSPELLERAYRNTIKILLANVQVVES